MGRQDLKDPMLHAAAEGIASDDHLRWMEYADQELARLRQRLGLPNPTGYSCGLPNYDVSGSERAQHVRREVERAMRGQFSPTDRVAVERVLDEIFAENEALIAAAEGDRRV